MVCMRIETFAAFSTYGALSVLWKRPTNPIGTDLSSTSFALTLSVSFPSGTLIRLYFSTGSPPRSTQHRLRQRDVTKCHESHGPKDLSTQPSQPDNYSLSCPHEGLLISTVLLTGMIGCALLIAGYLMFWRSKKMGREKQKVRKVRQRQWKVHI